MHERAFIRTRSNSQLFRQRLEGVKGKFSSKSHHRYRGAALELFKGSLYPYSFKLSTFQISALNRLLYNYYPRVERLNLLSVPNATLLNTYNQIRIASDKLKPKATKRLVATSMNTYNAPILKKGCQLPSAFCLLSASTSH